MSQTIRKMSISPMAGGYQARVILDNGHVADSKTLDSTDEASNWAINYAEQFEGNADSAQTPEMQATTHSTGQISPEELEKIVNSENEEAQKTKEAKEQAIPNDPKANNRMEAQEVPVDKSEVTGEGNTEPK